MIRLLVPLGLLAATSAPGADWTVGVGPDRLLKQEVSGDRKRYEIRGKQPVASLEVRPLFSKPNPSTLAGWKKHGGTFHETALVDGVCLDGPVGGRHTFYCWKSLPDRTHEIVYVRLPEGKTPAEFDAWLGGQREAIVKSLLGDLVETEAMPVARGTPRGFEVARPSPTPTATPDARVLRALTNGIPSPLALHAPTPEPVLVPTPTPVMTPVPTIAAALSPSPSASPSPSPRATPTPTPALTPRPTLAPLPTATPRPTLAPLPTPSPVRALAPSAQSLRPMPASPASAPVRAMPPVPAPARTAPPPRPPARAPIAAIPAPIAAPAPEPEPDVVFDPVPGMWAEPLAPIDDQWQRPGSPQSVPVVSQPGLNPESPAAANDARPARREPARFTPAAAPDNDPPPPPKPRMCGTCVYRFEQRPIHSEAKPARQ